MRQEVGHFLISRLILSTMESPEEQVYKFDFYLEPVPYTRVGYNRYGKAYIPAKENRFRENIKLLAKSQFKSRPLTEALKVTLVFDFEKGPYSRMKKYVVKRPDIDNLSKSIFDSLNKIVWEDDSQIVEVHAYKIFGDKPFIRMDVEVLK